MGKINISGEGKITTTPDIGFINVTIRSQGKKGKDAREQNNLGTSKVLDKLKNTFKIESKDLKTESLQTYPMYDNPKKGTKRAPKIVSYTVIHVLGVRIRDLSKIDEIIDGLDFDDAIEVGQISFGIDDETRNKLIRDVRRLAFDDAKAKAQLYCDQAGIKLGEIESLNENGGGGYRPQRAMMAMASCDSMEAPGAQVEAGEEEIRININACFNCGEDTSFGDKLLAMLKTLDD